MSYPASAETSTCALGLNPTQERQVAKLGENQQQNALHPLRCHLQAKTGELLCRTYL